MRSACGKVTANNSSNVAGVSGHFRHALIYRVFQKNGPLICFCNDFGKCTPILILFSLLQQENYDAQNLSYFSHLTVIMLPLT